MKKFLTSRIFVALLTAIIVASVSVYATIKIGADEVGYKDGTVKDAIDDLYSKTKNIYYVGNLNSSVTNNGATTSTFDIKNIYADYENLTIDNFVFQINNTFDHWRYNPNIPGDYNTLSESYDSSSGILTIVNAYGLANFRAGITGTVYLIPNISEIN